MNLYGFLVLALCFVEGLPRRNLSVCPTITLQNGRLRYRQKGKIVRFVCNNGYLLAGDRYSVCVGNKWDNTVSKCVRATCKDPKPPTNGLIYPSYGGAVLNFYCKSGFQLKGANITYCDGATWDKPLPTCLLTGVAPSLTCDFESEDLCGWNHDLNHDFDWKRLSHSTPSGSIGTGPSYDHTKGPGQDGHYMYIESSARNPNDKARLISPIYNLTVQNLCFEFYYHMYGSTTGSLRVYLKQVFEDWKKEDWTLNFGKELFVKDGNQGNRWLRGLINLREVRTEFQIVIEGVRGPSYVSDIAIDDIRIITNCIFEEELAATETTTEELMTSETPISVESCERRCNSNETQTFRWLLTCDCDESCFERNRCCPDYFDFCVSSTFSDDMNNDVTEPMIDTTRQPFPTTAKTTTTIKKPTPISKKPSPTTAKTTTTTKKPSPTSKKPSPTTTTRMTTTKKPYPSSKKPSPTPRTTKLTTTLAPPITTKATPPTTLQHLPTLSFENKNESKIVYVKPDEDDVDDVPEFELPDDPIKETEVINDFANDKNYDHQKIQVKSANMEEGHMKTIFFSVGVVFGVLFASVGMAFVARKYQLCGCGRMRFNQSSNGDSQSDVRFLTGDEVLDFNLDYDN